jgi:predicted DNA-binding transcriptional regulator YafY
MLETSARLLKLLSLLTARPEWPGALLADRLGVSARTIRRDIERLRALGYPVSAVSGTAGGYRLAAGANLPPLLLDDDEAITVAIALRTAAGGTVTGIEETSARALAKLDQVLPSRLRHRLDALAAVTVPLADPGPTVDAATLMSVAAACRAHERLRFDYTDREGAATVRTTEPHRLVATGRRWYLVAWDLDRDDWRTFRVDRVRPRVPTGPVFAPRQPPDPDVAAWASWVVSNASHRWQARFTLHAPAHVVAERVPATTGVVEAVDEHSCSVRVGSNSLDALAVHVAVIGVAFEVHEPPELIDRVRVLAGRLARAAELGARDPADQQPGEAPGGNEPGRRGSDQGQR